MTTPISSCTFDFPSRIHKQSNDIRAAWGIRETIGVNHKKLSFCQRVQSHAQINVILNVLMFMSMFRYNLKRRLQSARKFEMFAERRHGGVADVDGIGDDIYRPEKAHTTCFNVSIACGHMSERVQSASFAPSTAKSELLAQLSVPLPPSLSSLLVIFPYWR